jgi:phospholipase/lecithinase/hemolysin
MNKRLASLLLLINLSWFACGVSAKPFSELIIFGGSLADTGNFASVTGDLPPPHYQNRMSNGPVATDIVAAWFGFEAKPSLHLIGPPVGNNFAMNGSLASRESPIDLKGQMDAFFNSRNNAADPDALYLLLIGGNDVFEATFEPDDARSEQIVRDAVKGTEKAFHRLVGAGAKTILAANFFDLGIIPAARDAGLSEKASRLSYLFNRLTEQMFDRVEHRLDFELVRFDFDAVVKDALANKDELRFTNHTDACLPRIETGECDFEHYAFFNEYLPTARIHSLIGNAMTFAILQRDSQPSKHPHHGKHKPKPLPIHKHKFIPKFGFPGKGIGPIWW